MLVNALTACGAACAALLYLREGRVRLTVRKAVAELWDAPGVLHAPVTKDNRYEEGSLDALISRAGDARERVNSKGEWRTPEAAARWELAKVRDPHLARTQSKPAA